MASDPVTPFHPNRPEQNRPGTGELPPVGAIDIHCHILPGIDDGPETIEQAAALCRVMWREGVTLAVATPHQLGRYELFNDASRVRSLVTQLQEKLKQMRIGLEIRAGGEVRLDERIGRLLDEDRILTLADRKKHVLIELPPGLSLEPDAVLPRVKASTADAKVVLAHAERYDFIRKDAGAAQRWVDAGAIIQVNTGSLVGAYGPAEQACAWHLLSRGLVKIVASDAHNTTTRLPRWAEALRLITSRLGAAVARAVCVENPRRIIDGESVE